MLHLFGATFAIVFNTSCDMIKSNYVEKCCGKQDSIVTVDFSEAQTFCGENIPCPLNKFCYMRFSTKIRTCEFQKPNLGLPDYALIRPQHVVAPQYFSSKLPIVSFDHSNDNN